MGRWVIDDGCIEEWMDGWVGERLSWGQISVWMDGWMDG